MCARFAPRARKSGFRKAFLCKRSLFGELSRAAYAATKDFLLEHFRAIEGVVPARVVAPQSFGSLSPLEALFRERVFKALLENEATTEERVTLVRSWAHSELRVDSSRGVVA